MTRAPLVAWHEWASTVQRRSYLVATFGLPWLAGLFWGLMVLVTAPAFLAAAPASPPVGVVDPTGHLVPIADAFTEGFRAFPDEPAGRAALVRDEIEALVVADPTFATTGTVGLFVHDGVRRGRANEVPPFLQHGLLAAEVEPEVLGVALDPEFGMRVATTTLDDDGQVVEPSMARFWQEAAPAGLSLGILMVLGLATQALLRSVAEEKESRVLDVVLSSIPALDLLWGKVFGIGALVLTTVGIWAAHALIPLALGLGRGIVPAEPLPLVAAVAFFFVAYLQVALVMCAFGAVGANHKDSQQAAMIVNLPLWFGPYVALFYTMVDPNHAVLRAGSLLPLCGAPILLVRLPTGDVPWLEVLGVLAVQVSWLPAIAWAAGRVFRAGLLTYGTRLTWRQIAVLLRAR